VKSLFRISSVFILFGCGIVNLFSEFPQRYIKRNVQTQEVVGKWNITSESEAKLNEFRRSFTYWPVFAPWKTIQLNNDGTCQVKLEIQWLPNYSKAPTEIPREVIPNDVLSNNIIACSWKITNINGFSKEGNNTEVPGIEISIDYPNNYSSTFSLYIYEENNNLILWNFIGDADDFVPQDFMKLQY